MSFQRTFAPAVETPALAAAPSDELTTTVRVSNVTINATEEDLHDLFYRFGRILRLHLVQDRNTGKSRGFAFVTFETHANAVRAMQVLHGYGYDHQILHVEWAKAKATTHPWDAVPSFRSGYGTALAQDTNKKVFYT